MPNYNDNDTRDKAIDELQIEQNRMIFQLPNTESGATSPSVNPVFFCQSGCSIDYNFSNIKSCQFNNDGNKFTITPTDTANINYIMWNGTDINSGEKMTQFTLKEVYFTAPAKDYLGTNNDFLSQSIQYYFVFVNEKFNNLMICVSVIGSVNNLGNAPKSNGFVMMETLAKRIPSVNVQSQLNNLNNFNLGTLIPPNKPFFSTLITNNIQYIIITEIVDVPVEFFANMSTMVNEGLYAAKMNRNRTNIPKNPPTTILFYNENSQMLNDNQNLVCNSNCDLVPGKKITPTIGTYTTTQTEKKNENKLRTVSGAELPPEKCEMEEVWANQSLKPKSVKDPSKPKDPNDNRDPVIVPLTVSILIVLVVCTLIGFFKYANKNKLSIIILVIGLICLIVGLSVGCGIHTQTEAYYISYIFGAILWFISVLLLYRFKDYDSYGYGPNYSSFNLNTSPTAVKQQPYSGITVPTGFNQPKQSWFSKIFSRSDSIPTANYSPQITVPTGLNQPKQSWFSKSTEQSSTTIPQSSATVQSSMTIPQSSATVQSSQSSKSVINKLKDKFSTKTGSTMSSASSPITNPVINKVTSLITRISTEPNSKITPAIKNSLIAKLNRIVKNPSNGARILNEVNRELDKYK